MIDRTVVVDEDNGIVTTETTSENQQVRSWIQQHVEQMKALVENSKNNGGRRIRQWDPLFVAMFDHADRIQMGTNLTDDGIKVTQTTDGSECAMSLAEVHALAVSAFIDNGWPEIQSYHDVPAACGGSGD